MIPVIDILSQDGLFIVVIAVILNIFITYSYPKIHSILPYNIKNLFNSYQNVILNHRQNLIASSIFVVIIVISTLVLAPIVDSQQKQPSILNLANLSGIRL
jgi:hypothetical protein